MEHYEVTDKAGPYAAGRRVNPGDVIRLNAKQAWYELSLGTIRPVGPSAALADDGKGKRR
jgi:hypothetical protein